jgi:phage-related protein (TIGR01555 family)
VLCTDLSTLLGPSDAGGVLARADLFNAIRDNQGLMVVNKDSEDFKNVSASLSGLHELQAQAQEHMSSVSRIPLVKLTGISPSGLNASSEGEIRAYYDTIAAFQNRSLHPHLSRLINFQQLSLFGEVDPEIKMRFEPLWELSDAERGDKQKADGERHQMYVDMGAISPEDVRRVIVDDPELPYTNLDPDEVPDLLQEEEGPEPVGGRPDPVAEKEAGAEPGNDDDE